MSLTPDGSLLGIPETRLPADPAAAELGQGPTLGLGPTLGQVEQAAAAHPTSSLAWAILAEEALSRDRTVEAYAYARTGYHRGLDALRKSGWRGQGPVPWSHEPNQGFLRALGALHRAARAIGEHDEEQRTATFLRDSSREGAEALGL